MNEERLRDLGRRWRESPGAEEEAAWLRGQLRAGSNLGLDDLLRLNELDEQAATVYLWSEVERGNIDMWRLAIAQRVGVLANRVPILLAPPARPSENYYWGLLLWAYYLLGEELSTGWRAAHYEWLLCPCHTHCGLWRSQISIQQSGGPEGAIWELSFLALPEFRDQVETERCLKTLQDACEGRERAPLPSQLVRALLSLEFETTRELERRFRETGAPQDERTWLLERVRTGELAKDRLELAEWLGHPGAQRASWEIASFEVLDSSRLARSRPQTLEALHSGLGNWHHHFAVGLIALSLIEGPCSEAFAKCLGKTNLELRLLSSWLGVAAVDDTLICSESYVSWEAVARDFQEHEDACMALHALKFAYRAAQANGAGAQAVAHRALCAAEQASGLSPRDFLNYACQTLIRIAIEDIDFPARVKDWINRNPDPDELL